MVNLLLSKYNFDEPWISYRLKDIISSSHKVAVIPFSFHDDWIKNENQFNEAYNSSNGKYYDEIVKPFLFYGIKEENITFVNYFKDNAKSAKSIIENSNIVFFTGGLPDKMMDRIHKFHLEETLESYNGIVIGSSAGAMVQLKEYHISPDKDYPTFAYHKGLDMIKDFYIEVHYADTGIQNHSIKKVLCEKRKPIYTITNEGGILVIDNKVETFGDVDIYTIK